MFDFNTTDTNQEIKAIFNNGNAGRVANVQVSIQKKGDEDNVNSPDAKIIFTDDKGSMNLGWYHFTEDERVTKEKNDARAKNNILKLLAVSKAIVPEGYVFPDAAGLSIKQAEVALLKVISEFAGTLPVNVFACYGYTAKPKSFLEPRGFNFIERGSVSEEQTTLKKSNSDVMERLEPTPQAPAAQGAATGFGGGFGAPSAPSTSNSPWG